MKRGITFVLAFALWLLFAWSSDAQDVVAGAGVALLVALAVGDMVPEPVCTFVQPHRYLWFLCYLVVFFWQCVKANLDVAYRVLHPKMPIRPGIVKVHTELTTDMGKTFLANSITLTPGTFTMDIVDGVMYIHWINVTTADPEEETRLIVGRFERLLKKVFE